MINYLLVQIILFNRLSVEKKHLNEGKNTRPAPTENKAFLKIEKSTAFDSTSTRLFQLVCFGWYIGIPNNC